ncbi:MAG: hypothetical protein H6640_07685 [Caldilineaceae bacterium]|nr:hypothetical protein [Caldilineaceae bacterium]
MDEPNLGPAATLEDAIGVNFLAALLVYLLVAALVPAAANWSAAILVGWRGPR